MMRGDGVVANFRFVVVGPQRTGTSWLDRVLRSQEGVCLPKNVKETFAFDSESNFDIQSYRKRYFLEVASGSCLGEVSPTYFHSGIARERLREHFPRLKIVIILRDPVERGFSLFRHEVAKGRSPDDLRVAVNSNHEIIESGKYSRYVRAWQRDFGVENVLLVWFDDISRRPDAVLKAVCEHIGIECADLPPTLAGVYGAGVVPRFRLLAKYASKLARLFRRLKLDAVVEFGKAVGLPSIVYSGGDSKELSMSQDDEAFLQKLLRDDIAFVAMQKKEVRNDLEV